MNESKEWMNADDVEIIFSADFKVDIPPWNNHITHRNFMQWVTEV